MLLEGALAVVVILCCCAGLAMGVKSPKTGELLTGRAAWESRYQAKIVTQVDPQTGQPVIDPKTGREVTQGGWKNQRLKQNVGAFVEGGANFLHAIGIQFELGITIVAVLVASFAATTLDTATRLERYVVQELAGTFGIQPLRNKYLATAVVVSLAFIVALIPGPGGAGTGGLILWPLFGATNQLLAGLAFLVTIFYLWRRNRPVWFIIAPALVMLIMPAWAMLWNLFATKGGWLGLGTGQPNYVLVGIGVAILALQIWIVVEALLVWPRAKGVLEEALPPLSPRATAGSRT
jgi:carbon starvation protein